MAEHRGRLLAVSVVVLVLFVVLVGRLGQVQLVEGADTAVSAGGTNTRTLPVPAVRGRILDRHGVPLVANTTSLTVTMDRRVFTAQPTRARESLTSLATLLHRDPSEVIGRAHLCGEDGAPKPPICWNGSPQVPVPVALDVYPTIALTLLERPDLHPGLGVRTEVARTFPSPDGVNAAQLLGYLGRVTGDEVSGSDGRLGVDDLIGRAGLEEQYDRQLRGTAGAQVVAVDPRGLVLREVRRTDAVPGRDLRTSLDAALQAGTERVLADGIADARGRAEDADSAAAVVLDAGNGQVLASASVPTYDPGVWTGGITAADYAWLTDPAAGHPLLSRVTGVTFPPASTIKALSVPAAVRVGDSLTDLHSCPASYQIGDRAFHNF